MIYTDRMKKFTCDRTSFTASTARTYTDEGFLRVPGFTARIGVQDYLASELGLTDRPPNQVVRVMRPPESVFDAESLASYDGADVTNDHPSELVNPTTFKNTVVGTVRTVGVQDGDYVKAELIIKDADAIRAVESGKVQLSAGYTSVYDEAPSGADYDFIQRDIKINHVALVTAARAGHQAKLFDNNGVKPMKKVTLDSGKTVEVQDEATATLLTDTFDRLTKRAMDAEAKADKADAEKDAKDEELEEAKKASSDEAIKQRVESVTRTALDAKKVAGKHFTCDSVNEVEIKRASLAVKFPKRAWADKSTAYVEAAFDAAVEVELTGEEDEEDVKNQQTKAAQDAASGIKLTNDAAPKLNGMQKLQQSRALAANGGK